MLNRLLLLFAPAASVSLNHSIWSSRFPILGAISCKIFTLSALELAKILATVPSAAFPFAKVKWIDCKV